MHLWKERRKKLWTTFSPSTTWQPWLPCTKSLPIGSDTRFAAQRFWYPFTGSRSVPIGIESVDLVEAMVSVSTVWEELSLLRDAPGIVREWLRGRTVTGNWSW